DHTNSSLVMNLRDDTTGLIYGSSTFGRLLRFTDVVQSKFYDLGIDGNGSFFIMNQGSTNEGLVMDESGNVGIGITAPNVPHAQLDLGNHSNPSRTLALQTDGNFFYGFGNDNRNGTGYLDMYATGGLTNNTASDVRMSIGHTGNVGIGTLTPET